MAELTASQRKALNSSDFIFPSSRRYPIENIAHAKDALARSSGKVEEKAVQAAVYKRYPSLKNSGENAADAADNKKDATVTDVADAHKVLSKAQADLQAKKEKMYKKYPHMDPKNDPGTGKPWDHSKMMSDY